MIVVLGAIQGYLGYRAIGDFASSHQETLIKQYNLSRRKVPSFSTIRRVMMGVDWFNLQQIFNQWSSHLGQSNELRNWVCIDGKSLSRTMKNPDSFRQNVVSLVSWYSQNNGVVLGLNRFENQHCSEIQQVQELVKDCSLKNTVFTLDALHCQKRTVQQIMASNNHYLITVKKNQKKLYQTL